jgi:hypothetical protein
MQFFLLLFALLSGQIAAQVDDIEKLFTSLKDPGSCTGYLDSLNEYLVEAIMNMATTKPQTQQGTVARELLNAWMGIEIDEEGEAVVADDDHHR